MQLNFSDRRLLGLIFFLVFFAAELAAQHIHEERAISSHPVLNSIEEAALRGVITEENAILQKIYAGYTPERLDARFLADIDTPIRCMVPVLTKYYHTRNILDPAIVAEIEEIIHPRTTLSTKAHISDSGRFVLYYDVEGNNAVPMDDLNNSGIPDYVEHAAFAADSSYRYQVDQLGFVDFLKEEPYEIFFRNFRFYGTTAPSGSTTFITIHSNFSGFPPNTHPMGNQIGALYATIAHEIKHAIQYASNRWTGEAGSFDWIEMDATLMEEVTFDDVNDYYNYIMTYNTSMGDWDWNNPRGNSIFGSPGNPIPGAYWHITWMLYFFENYGGEFWVDIWDEIRVDYLNKRALDPQNPDYTPILSIIQKVLNQRNLTLEQEHINNHLWHMASGPIHSPLDFGFEERTFYPTPRFHWTNTTIPDSLSNQFVRAMAANYIDVLPSNITLGQPLITLESNVNGVGLGVIGYFRDGSTDVQISVNPISNIQSVQTTWSWSDLVDLNIAIVNTNREENAVYNLGVSSRIPEEDTISQNYPNPFNPSTRIEFSLSNTKPVKIEVYDRIGRKVSTLLDGTLERGFHTVTFDGAGLSSGLYFYRITTDQAQMTKKMILVK
jgi:hypothetical protein